VRHATLLCVCSLLVAWPVTISAQVAPQLPPGALIRVAESGSTGNRVGTLLSATMDTVVLRAQHGVDTLRIPFSRVSRLDVSRGWHSRIRPGIKYGALAGAVVGGLVALSACQGGSCKPEQTDFTLGAVLLGGVLGAGSGALVGAAVGAASSGEQWEQLPPSRWRLSLRSLTNQRFALAASITF
jgi:hypothetical protein